MINLMVANVLKKGEFSRRNSASSHMLALGLSFLWCIAGTVAADALDNMMIPLIIGSNGKILDESGNELVGSYSLEPSACDLVQILWATNGIYPPNTDGTPHQDNPVMMASYIGSETCYGVDNPSLFSATIDGGGKIPSSSPFFVRVFNAPTCQEATYYGDSIILSNNSASTINRIIVSIPSTSQAVDPEAASLVDSDGDGMSDTQELLAGTDRFNASSVLSVQLDFADGQVLKWLAVPGKVYAVERNTVSLMNPVWEPVTVVTASTEVVELSFPDDPNAQQIYYRIRLVLE